MSASAASWAPAFPFGAGESYTTFTQALLSVSTNASHVAVSVNVTNTGPAASKQVVGAYYEMPTSRNVRHHKRLLAFAKTDVLPPGGSATLTMAAPIVEGLGTWEPAQGSMVVEPGVYTVSVGPDSVTVSGSQNITL